MIIKRSLKKKRDEIIYLDSNHAFYQYQTNLAVLLPFHNIRARLLINSFDQVKECSFNQIKECSFDQVKECSFDQVKEYYFLF